jgi:hypothetical protein
MQLDPKVSWWLNFILFALQSAASIAWSQYLDPKTAALCFLVLGYVSQLLSFAVHGSVPGVQSQVNNVGKMLILFFVLVLALLWCSPTRAADLAPVPVKAQPIPYISQSPCTISSCSGFYVGAGLTGNGTNADIVGNGINGSVFAEGGAIDVHAGYQLWNGQFFAALEGGVGYQYTNGGVAVSGSNVTGYEIVKLGYGLQGLINQSTTVPGQAASPITVPAALAGALMSPYIAMGGIQTRGTSVWASGAGAEFLLASHYNLDIRYMYAASQQGLPPVQQVTLGVNYHF